MIKRNEDIIMIHTQTLSENLDQKTNIITITQNQTKQIINEVIKQLEPIAKIYEMIEPLTQYLISPKNGANDDSVIAEFLKDLEKIDDSINTVDTTLGAINNNVKDIGTNIETEGDKIDGRLKTVNETFEAINDNLKNESGKDNIYSALKLISDKINNIKSYDGENIKSVLNDIKDTISKLYTNEFKFNISENSTLHSALVGNSDSIRAALAGDSGSIKSVISNLDNTISKLNISQTNNTELNDKLEKITSSLDNIKSTLSNKNDFDSITYKINAGLSIIGNQLDALNNIIDKKFEVSNITEFNTLKNLDISENLILSASATIYNPEDFKNCKIFDYYNSGNINSEFFAKILNILGYFQRIIDKNLGSKLDPLT